KATSRATTTSWRCRGLQWPRSKPQPSRSSHAANERLLHPLTPQIRCSSPPPCGEGLGVGVVRFFRRWRHRALTASPPLPNPPPQGGRERTECGEREAHRERGEEDRVGESAYFVWLNRGKESVVLDLARADDKALLAAMLAKADVFVQNLKPGAIAKLGFPLDALRRAHPRLVICSISGYGEDGPYAHRKAYDMLVQAESGLASITGGPEAPARVGVSVCDIAAGMNAYEAILAALYAREQT